MKLYKYCESKFNPLNGCTTLRVGTTEYFRKNYKGEEDMIGDPREGVSSYKDHNSNFYENFKTAPNTYILCFSTNRVSDEVIKQDFDSNYESHYTLHDWQRFAGTVAGLLEMNFCLDDIDLNRTKVDFRKLSLTELQRFSFQVFGDIIKYVPSKTYGPFKSKEDRAKVTIFTKDAKYISQKEFRIAFFLHHPLFGYLSVKEEPKVLDTRLVNYYLSSETLPMDNIIVENNYFINKL